MEPHYVMLFSHTIEQSQETKYPILYGNNWNLNVLVWLR